MILVLLVIIGFLFAVNVILWNNSYSLRWKFQGGLFSFSKDRHHQDYASTGHVKKCLHHLHKQAQWLGKYPEKSIEILSRLKFLLPAGNLFKDQRQKLHDLMHHIHKTHKPHSTQKDISPLLRRLQKIDNMASLQEGRINHLHDIAEKYTAVQHHTKLRNCIKDAIKLQNSNRKLLKNIHGAEIFLKRFLSTILSSVSKQRK